MRPTSCRALHSISHEGERCPVRPSVGLALPGHRLACANDTTAQTLTDFTCSPSKESIPGSLQKRKLPERNLRLTPTGGWRGNIL